MFSQFQIRVNQNAYITTSISVTKVWPIFSSCIILVNNEIDCDRNTFYKANANFISCHRINISSKGFTTVAIILSPAGFARRRAVLPNMFLTPSGRALVFFKRNFTNPWILKMLHSIKLSTATLRRASRQRLTSAGCKPEASAMSRCTSIDFWYDFWILFTAADRLFLVWASEMHRIVGDSAFAADIVPEATHEESCAATLFASIVLLLQIYRRSLHHNPQGLTTRAEHSMTTICIADNVA